MRNGLVGLIVWDIRASKREADTNKKLISGISFLLFGSFNEPEASL